MRRRQFLAGLSAGTVLLAGCAGGPEEETTTAPGTDPTTEPPTTEPPTTEPPTVDPGLRNGDFEAALDHWTVGRQLPDDPNSGGKVDSAVEPTTERAASGQQALRIFIDGSQDDGTVWVQQEVALSEVSTLRVDGYSPEQSFNEILQVAAYAGPVPEDGLVEQDFDRSNRLADHEGWKTYEYDVERSDNVGGRGLVAVGLNIVWETGAAGILDNVRLE